MQTGDGRCSVDTSDSESVVSEASNLEDFEDLLDGPVTGGKFNKRLLTFIDRSLEEEFIRKWDDQNLRPATVLLSVFFGLYFFHLVLMRSMPKDLSKLYGFLDLACINSTPGIQDPFFTQMQSANVAWVLFAGSSVFVLRRRWFSCETVTLVTAVLLSGSIFLQLRYYWAKLVHTPYDFTMSFFIDEPQAMMGLLLINMSVQVLRIRSSRSWILPSSQLIMLLGVHLTMAPLRMTDIALLDMFYAFAAYYSWRGRRREERRARTDYLENRELRIKMREERVANRIQLRRFREIEEQLVAMERICASIEIEKPQEVAVAPEQSSRKEDLRVPRPPRCGDSSFSHRAVASSAEAELAAPNEVLRLHMAGRCADAARIRRMAECIVLEEYGIESFLDDTIAAFPELELFFTEPGESGEMEYQRTMGALFSVYWLLRLESDGKQGFCLGVAGDWRNDNDNGNTKSGDKMRASLIGSSNSGNKNSSGNINNASMCKSRADMKNLAKREKFLEATDWSKMQEIVSSSIGCGGTSLDVGRVEAMLCLTAFHDILKMPWLCPKVAEAHAPYKGYSAGVVIHDHDVALAYVMDHYPELLPSFDILPPRMKELVLFTQSKMQFNHGWFVQAEAPPGLLLGSLKACLTAAHPGDVLFYFFHWLTDVAGAEGTPKGGAEKLVLKFPQPVLAAFLWSIPFLEHLKEYTETQVTEKYLAARWQTTFPDALPPAGTSSVALLRLTVMAQSEAGSVAEAFHTLPIRAQELLSWELALTGCDDQYFESYSSSGGPAFLIYYGPALLQRCRGVEEMALGLQVLAAVLAASRTLWPRSRAEQASTVVVNVGELRKHDISSIINSSAGEPRSLWVLLRKSDREAALELIPMGDVNQLNCKRAIYWVLDSRFQDGSDSQTLWQFEAIWCSQFERI